MYATGMMTTAWGQCWLSRTARCMLVHAGGDAGEGRLHAIWSAADDRLIGIVADVGSDTCRVLRDEELDQFL